MPSGHFGLNGAYHEDPGAALQRWHRERVAAEATQERTEKWLWRRLAGQSFDSLEALTDAALATTADHYDRDLTEQETTLVVRAAVALNCGFVDAAFFAGKLRVTRGERVEFLRAG